MTGYIKSYRQMYEHPLLGQDRNARSLFQDLLHFAAWQDTTQDWAGKPVTVCAGQIMMSTREMERRFGVSRQSIRTAIRKLVQHNIVEINPLPNNGPLIVTVCNWTKFQSHQPTINPDANPTLTHYQPTKEEGEELEERKTTTVAVRRAPLFGSQQMELPSDMDPDLEAIRQKWNAYAKEAGKAQVRKLTKDRRDAIRQIIADNGYTFADIDEAIEMASRSNYLTEEGWFSFDWLFKSGSNISKVQEGKYGNGRHAETEEDLARDGLAILREFGLAEEATQ